MSRPGRTTIEPRTFEYGAIAQQTGQWDTYFADVEPDAFQLILAALVERLQEPDRASVQMCVMAGMTYQEAADWFTAVRGATTDRRTVWRWARRGLLTVQEWLEVSPWVSAMTAGRVPLPEGEVLSVDGPGGFEDALSRPLGGAPDPDWS